MAVRRAAAAEQFATVTSDALGSLRARVPGRGRPAAAVIATSTRSASSSRTSTTKGLFRPGRLVGENLRAQRVEIEPGTQRHPVVLVVRCASGERETLADLDTLFVDRRDGDEARSLVRSRRPRVIAGAARRAAERARRLARARQAGSVRTSRSRWRGASRREAESRATWPASRRCRRRSATSAAPNSTTFALEPQVAIAVDVTGRRTSRVRTPRRWGSTSSAAGRRSRAARRSTRRFRAARPDGRGRVDPVHDRGVDGDDVHGHGCGVPLARGARDRPGLDPAALHAHADGDGRARGRRERDPPDRRVRATPGRRHQLRALAKSQTLAEPARLARALLVVRARACVPLGGAGGGERRQADAPLRRKRWMSATYPPATATAPNRRRVRRSRSSMNSSRSSGVHALSRSSSRPRCATTFRSCSRISPASSISQRWRPSQKGRSRGRQAWIPPRQSSTSSASTHSPTGHVKPVNGATSPSRRNLYAITATSPPGTSPAAVLERCGNVLSTQRARGRDRRAHLVEVRRAAVAEDEVLLETLGVRLGQTLFEVGGDQLHHLGACQFTVEPHRRYSSSARRTFERARCNSTR